MCVLDTGQRYLSRVQTLYSNDMTQVIHGNKVTNRIAYVRGVRASVRPREVSRFYSEPETPSSPSPTRAVTPQSPCILRV